MEFEIFFSGSAMRLFPVDTFVALMRFDDTESVEIPKRYPFQNEWGQETSTMIMLSEKHPIPKKIDLVYLSLVEEGIYSVKEVLPYKEIEREWVEASEKKSPFEYIVVGMAPYGYTAIWLRGVTKSIIAFCTKGMKINVNPNILMQIIRHHDLHSYCNYYLSNLPLAFDYLQQNGLPPRDLFDNYMKQFTYRYQVILEHWDEDEEKWIKYDEEKDEVIPEFEYIEEALFDGTHDKLHDGGLMKYHEAGKPKKLALKWHIKKSDYSAYFWFEDEEICAIFNKFYGQHPDSKTDFIIHIDPIKKKYELSLYRYGLKQPVIIPESAYQLIVFKSGFENYRSDNYNQPTVAWIW